MKISKRVFVIICIIVIVGNLSSMFIYLKRLNEITPRVLHCVQEDFDSWVKGFGDYDFCPLRDLGQSFKYRTKVFKINEFDYQNWSNGDTIRLILKESIR